MRENNYNVEVMNHLNSCNVVTCIHCISGLCSHCGECDLYERVLVQEY